MDINHLRTFPLHSQQFLKNNSVFQKHEYRVVGWAHRDCEQIMWFYHSCKVVGGSIPENVRLCLLYFLTFCEQSTFIKKFKFSNIICLLLVN